MVNLRNVIISPFECIKEVVIVKEDIMNNDTLIVSLTTVARLNEVGVFVLGLGLEVDFRARSSYGSFVLQIRFTKMSQLVG